MNRQASQLAFEQLVMASQAETQETVGARTITADSHRRKQLLVLCVLLLIDFQCLQAAAPLPSGHPRLQITAERPAPVIVHVGTVDARILALEIEAQRTGRSAVQPYRPLPGDKTVVKRQHGIVKSVELVRDGKPVAYLAGKDRRHVWFFEQLIGDPLDTARADDPQTYTLCEGESTTAMQPRAVYRKSKPVDIVYPASTFPKRHTLYLEWPDALIKGQHYTLRFAALQLQQREVSFTHDPRQNRSEAIHVSHVGFRPDDPVKQAFLSIWLGNGGAHRYDGDRRFELLDQETGRPVFAGRAANTWPADRPERIKREQNHNLTDVAVLDFSSYKMPGLYRLSVEGVGCSCPFHIADPVWQKPFRTAMKGFYHQRSGIPLEEPFSTFTRPRPYHPEDGLEVFASDVTLMETRNGLNFVGESSNFEALNEHVTDRVVANAWGGYFDAADWDRRIQHLTASRYHLELMELFPKAFSRIDLNIPESGNAIPDLLDEVLFNVDCYRRLQTTDGGIRGGIEATEHPVRGETSWLESLRVMAYAPGPWSSYLYAGVAARTAHLLRSHDRERADTLERSARRAWDWAEAHIRDFAEQYDDHARWRNVSAERNLAALELYRLAEDTRWHDRFLQDTVLMKTQDQAKRQHSEEQMHALFLYARLPGELGDEQLKEAARRLIVELADRCLGSADRNAWGLISCNPYRATGTAWFSTPDLIPLIRAHALSQEARFLDAIVRGVQFSVGANPMNMTYTTGVGHEWPRNAMVLDSRRTARAVPEGITVFGQVDYKEARRRNHKWHLGALDWFLVRKQAIYPDPFTWPVTESYWDIHQWPSACEFTPQGTMGKVSYIWGYLAAPSFP